MESLHVDAILFDLDGTLVDSISVVDRAWERFLLSRGLEPGEHLPTIHGKRSVESIRRLLPHLDAESENLELCRIEVEESATVRAFPGVLEALTSLPRERWAIVTSGTFAVANSRIVAAGIPPPGALITADDVARGKPHPDPFVAGARALGFEPTNCAVFEDTAAGIVAARAAGCAPLAVNDAAQADFVLEDWRDFAWFLSPIGLKITGFRRTRL